MCGMPVGWIPEKIVRGGREGCEIKVVGDGDELVDGDCDDGEDSDVVDD